MDASGKQTNLAREEARAIVKRCCNAPTKDYALIFIGSGSTSAINLLLAKLQVKEISANIKSRPNKKNEEEANRPPKLVRKNTLQFY